MSDDIRNKRESEQSETLHKTAKIISGLLPIGGSVYELFAALVKPQHEKRKEKWIREVTLRLHNLEAKEKIDLRKLSENEEFNTVITKATLLAQQNHQQEKIEALRSIVINTSLKISEEVLDFEIVDYFLSIIDWMSPLHILLLQIFSDPKTAGKENNLSLAQFLKIAKTPRNTYGDFFIAIFPELKSKKVLIEMCWKDLHRYRLVEYDQIFIGDNLVRVGMSLTSDLGNQFLQMIEEED